MSTSRLSVRPRLVPLLGVGAGLLLGGVLAGFVVRQPPALSPRFNHVMLYVSDLDASIAFYTRAFEVEIANRIESLTVVTPDGTETERPVRMAFLKFPGQEFVLELSEQRIEAGEAGGLYQHLGVDVTDIEAAAERAQTAGARDFSGIRTVRASGGIEARNAFFLGPDGELLELMQMVAGEF
jgi:catechol 2,3-dioxygenase-like lactoylglutathione lyase family enzyme